MPFHLYKVQEQAKLIYGNRCQKNDLSLEEGQGSILEGWQCSVSCTRWGLHIKYSSNEVLGFAHFTVSTVDLVNVQCAPLSPEIPDQTMHDSAVLGSDKPGVAFTYMT